MTDKKILFGFVAKEGEIQNIDELCKNIDLEENFVAEEVVAKILMANEPLDMAAHASSIQSEYEIPNNESKDADE